MIFGEGNGMNGQNEGRKYLLELGQNFSCKLIQLVNKLVDKQLMKRRRIRIDVFGADVACLWLKEKGRMWSEF